MSRCRSVNDFDTPEGLKKALGSNDTQSSFADAGRDFPRALVGSSLAVSGDDNTDAVSVSSEASSAVESPDGELDWVLTNYHAESSHSQSLKEELLRLEVLRSYLILDSEREASFERLTGLASRIFKVPIALVSLVDLGRQWFMSNRGLGDVRQTPRSSAFCAHAILGKGDMLIVTDATIDVRFKDNPLVLGWPHIRFYAGAPLMCPEGYKLGTLCVIDTKVRPEGLNLEQKQNLKELADMVVDTMVERRRERVQVMADKSRMLATTAHDLLTPLSGVQMSLCLLQEDEQLKQNLSETQMELVSTAASCAEVMNRICHSAMDSFRGDLIAKTSQPPRHRSSRRKGSLSNSSSDSTSSRQIKVFELVQSLNMVLEPYPKQVPIFITVDPGVPPVIVSEDLKIFRCALNFLTNAAKKTTSGSIQLKIYMSRIRESPKLVFECVDTGPGVELAMYPYLFRPFRACDAEDGKPANLSQVSSDVAMRTGNLCSVAASMDNSGLGLYSVAHLITSLGGEYGFRPREEGSGAVFWFSIPLVVPPSSTDSMHASESSIGSSELAPPNNATQLTTSTMAAPPNGGVASNGRHAAIKPVPISTVAPPTDGRGKIRVLTTGALSEKENQKVLDTVKVALGSAEKRGQVGTQKDNAQRVRRALIIDDSLVIRKSVSRALKQLGFEVTAAANGLEGLKQLRSKVFDVSLCDYLMPVMDGLDCVQQYRDWEKKHRPWIRQHIVGISAHASAKDVEKGKKAGMNDFKAKPVTLKVLKELEESDTLEQMTKELDRVMSLQGGQAMSDMDNDSELAGEDRRVEDNAGPNDCGGKACLIAEESNGSLSSLIIPELEARRWQFVAVNDGEDALRLMKMRNWGAIYMDENLPRLTGVRCMERFRVWEAENRIKRQTCVFLVSTSYVPSPSHAVRASGSYPAGFDGALGKPVLIKDFRTLLVEAESKISETANPEDILQR